MGPGRRIVCVSLLAAMLACLISAPSSAINPQPEPPNEIRVLVDDNPLSLDVAPIIDQGRTLVPLRAIFEALGATIEWNGAERRITARKGRRTISLQVGNPQASIVTELLPWVDGFAQENGPTTSQDEQVPLDVAPKIVNDRTMVPVRFVSEALGAAVDWDGTERKVLVKAKAGVQAVTADLTGVHGTFWAQRKPESRNASRPTRLGTVLVLVDHNVYNAVKSSIATYTADLAAEGYASDVYMTAWGDHRDLKQFIRQWWAGLAGAVLVNNLSLDDFKYGSGVVLVGDLPIPWVHQRIGKNDKGQPYEGTFACDLYLTDMNGNWDYVDDEGNPFISTVDPNIIPIDSECTVDDFNSPKWKTLPDHGKGGAKPELWIGRIMPGPLCLDPGTGKPDPAKEAQMINEYFTQNHAYRHGHYPQIPQGQKGEDVACRDRMLYYDNDWKDMAPSLVNSIAEVWPGPIVADSGTAASSAPVNRYVNGKNITWSSDYEARLKNGRFLWVESLMHSGPNVHEFGQHYWDDSKKDWAWSPEGSIFHAAVNWKALFYYLQGCDTSDYTRANNLGTEYLFKSGALAVLGNTTVGPHDTGVFYKMLASGMNLGQSYMLNQRAYMSYDAWPSNWAKNPPDPGSPKRYYSQVFLGDPTLRPIPFIPTREPVHLHTQMKDYTVTQSLPASVQIPGAGKAKSDAEKRQVAEARDRLKRVAYMPSPGIRYLDVGPGKRVLDPNWLDFTHLRLLQMPIIPLAQYNLTLEPDAATVTYGQTVTLSGKLTTTAQTAATAAPETPVAGKTVRIFKVEQGATTGGDEVKTLKGTVTTAGDGVYKFSFAPAETATYVALFSEDDQELARSDTSTITLTRAALVYDLTLRPAQASVTAGQVVTLSGALTSRPATVIAVSTGTPLPGKQIKIYEVTSSAAARSTQRALKATVTTGSGGEYSYEFTPAQNGTFVAVYSEGTQELAASNQAVIAVTQPQVQYNIALEPGTVAILAGQSVTLTGELTSRIQVSDVIAVSSPVAGKPVKIYEVTEAAVTGTAVIQQRTLKATVTTGSDGKYSYQFTPGQSGKYVAVFAEGDRETATSDQSSVTVNTLRIQAPTQP